MVEGAAPGTFARAAKTLVPPLSAARIDKSNWWNATSMSELYGLHQAIDGDN